MNWLYGCPTPSTECRIQLGDRPDCQAMFFKPRSYILHINAILTLLPSRWPCCSPGFDVNTCWADICRRCCVMSCPDLLHQLSGFFWALSPSGNCCSLKRAAYFKVTPLIQGQPISNEAWWRLGGNPALLFQLGTTLSFRATCEVSWGLCWAWTVTQSLPLFSPTSFYSLLHCWSSEHSPVNFLLVNLCFRVRFLRNQICTSIHAVPRKDRFSWLLWLSEWRDQFWPMSWDKWHELLRGQALHCQRKALKSSSLSIMATGNVPEHSVSLSDSDEQSFQPPCEGTGSVNQKLTFISLTC